MKRSQITMAAGLVFAAAAAIAPITASSGAVDSNVPSYKEFKASTYVDTDAQYIVNGDEAIRSDGDLKKYYERMVGSKDGNEQGLVVNTVNGADDKWSTSQVGNLTYCVSTKFGSNYAAVVQAAQQGTALWEGASSRINYTYVPSADSSCTTRNNAVVFSIEPTNTTQYIARAFFPSTPDRGRNILVNAVSLQNSGSWTPANILGHELGHTLGFRHEHTRPEAGTCFEDNNWRPLTPYDSSSIMHYPQCNGSSNDLSMTSSDRQGAAALYGA